MFTVSKFASSLIASFRKANKVYSAHVAQTRDLALVHLRGGDMTLAISFDNVRSFDAPWCVEVADPAALVKLLSKPGTTIDRDSGAALALNVSGVKLSLDSSPAEMSEITQDTGMQGDTESCDRATLISVARAGSVVYEPDHAATRTTIPVGADAHIACVHGHLFVMSALSCRFSVDMRAMLALAGIRGAGKFVTIGASRVALSSLGESAWISYPTPDPYITGDAVAQVMSGAKRGIVDEITINTAALSAAVKALKSASGCLDRETQVAITTQDGYAEIRIGDLRADLGDVQYATGYTATRDRVHEVSHCSWGVFETLIKSLPAKTEIMIGWSECALDPRTVRTCDNSLTWVFAQSRKG